MAKRGRKSSAELSVVSIGIDTRRPAPPGNLTKPQADIWRAIVADLPGGWITGAQEFLLAAYCRHADAGNWLSKQIDGHGVEPADIPRLSRLLGMRIRETGAMMSLATKMRLTQQARMHPRTAGRATSDASAGRRLWQRPWETE